MERDSGSSLTVPRAQGNRVVRLEAAKRDFCPLVAKSLIPLAERGSGASWRRAGCPPRPVWVRRAHFFFCWALAWRRLVAHSSQHTSTGLPPIFTVMVDLGSSG